MMYNKQKYNKKKEWKSIKEIVESPIKNKEKFPGVNEVERYHYGDETYKIYAIFCKNNY